MKIFKRSTNKRKHLTISKADRFDELWRKLRPVERILSLTGVLLILLSVIVPAVSLQSANKRYSLNSQSKSLAGESTDQNLEKYVTVDKKTGDIIYKKDLVNAPPKTDSSIKQGGGDFSITVFKDPKKGISYYDPETTQSFSIKPQFEVMEPRQEDGHILIPLKKGSNQQVITIKGNGVKEDFILNVPQGNDYKFSYKLELPASLEARMLDSGEIGIYTGSDTTLFGPITYGSEKDKELVAKAQRNATKDKLAFILPAPVIKQSGNADLPDETKSTFRLADNILTVESTGLAKLNYPISIDPSTIVTSATDFDKGHNEGNITRTSGFIQRTPITGGSYTGWASTDGTSHTMPSFYPSAAIYNNFIYVVGGCTVATDFTSVCPTVTNNVEVGAIQSNGTIIWQTHISGDDLPVAWRSAGIAMYNGYIYVAGGLPGGTSPATNNTVYYSKIKSDGHIQGWQTTSSMVQPRGIFGMQAARGYIYAAGGCASMSSSGANSQCSTVTGGEESIEYAPIKADGTLGTWASAGAFPQLGGFGGLAVNGITYMTIYNDSVYVSYNALGVADYHLHYYIQNDGTLRGSNGTSIDQGGYYPIIRYAYGGYVYSTSAGYPVASPGTISAEDTDNDFNVDTFPGAITAISCTESYNMLAYKNYAYCLGGTNILTPDTASSYTSFTGAPTLEPSTWYSDGNTGQARNNICVVAHDGYVYQVGGSSGGNGTANPPTNIYNNVFSAAILSTGGLGTWRVNGNNLLNVTASGNNIAGRTRMTCQVHNGRIYIIGGNNHTSGVAGDSLDDIQYAGIQPLQLINFTDGSRTGGTATLTGLDSPHYFEVGQEIFVSAADTGYNGWRTVTAVTPTSVSWSQGGTDASSGSGNIQAYGFVFPFAQATGKLPSRLSYPSSAVSANADGNTYLYVFGGGTGQIEPFTTQSGAHYYARIDATTGDVCGDDGVGGWTCNGTAYSTNLKSTTTGVPTTATYGSTLLAHNNYLYFAGGETNTAGTVSRINNTYSVAIASGGNITASWASTGTMPTARARHSMVLWNGYLYVLGGVNGTGSTTALINGTALDTIEYAQVNSGGALGTWTNTGLALDQTTSRHGSIASDGYIYIISGQRGASASQTVRHTMVKHGGGGATRPFKTLGSGSLPATRYGHSSYVYNGFLYVSGGITGGAVDNHVLKYNLVDNSSGWTTETNTFATSRWGHSMLFYNNTAYILGGCQINDVNTCTSTDTLNDVQRATVNSDGTLGAWTPDNSFTNKRVQASAVVYNGYIYVAGGSSNTSGFATTYNDVQYVAINSNGSLGSWAATTASFTTSRYQLFAFVYNSYLYIGGGINGLTTLTDMQYGQIGSNGNITSWTQEKYSLISTNDTERFIAAYAENGFVHVVGHTSVLSAPISNTGQLNNNWSVSSNYPPFGSIFPYYLYGLAYYKGRAYFTGGVAITTAAPQSTAYTLSSYTAPRIATYSHWIDTEVDTSPEKIIFRGSNTANPRNPGSLGPGGINVLYKTVQASGTGWGTNNLFNSGLSNILGTAMDYRAFNSSNANMGLGKAYLLTIILDDSQTATFPDTSGNNSTITDFEFWYHANSGRRLRGGETFTNEVRQSLDAYPR